MSSPRQRFLDLLRRDILELDAAELDFGIYRVLNHRRATVDRFLNEELPARIEAALTRLPGLAGEDEEARIYNALYTFFSRYYDSGDFLPRQRRGKAGRYSVPYDGSDTHFHWATKGSHYVKSGERFAAYAYTQSDGTRVRLVVQAASVERDNAKGAQRHYVPAALAAPGPAHPGEWRLAFEHRPLTEDELARAGGSKRGRAAAPAADTTDEGEEAAAGASVQERLLNAWLAQANVPPAVDVALLARHALRYVKGQSTDFFVHPQLGRFLRDELDHYLQGEFVNLWALPDDALARERGKLATCRDVGRAIIEVLATLEDLQAALFEKRKFVLEASYLVMCSWLRAQGEAGAALVAQAAGHAPQVARWRQWLGEPAESAADGAALLARCPHLPLDTALFEEDFKWAVLACVPDFQAALGGILVHGDNYAALRTLEAQWRAGVKCIYIDPPYNTGKDGFLYKDGYLHSTWHTLLEERLALSKTFLQQDGTLLSSIDEVERNGLVALCDLQFGVDCRIGSLVWKGATDNNPTRIAIEHEYVLAYARSIEDLEETWSTADSAIKTLMLAEYERICTETPDFAQRQVRFGEFANTRRNELGDLYRYRRVDEIGPYAARRNMDNPGKPGYFHDVIHPVSGRPCLKPFWGWRFPESTMSRFRDEGRLIFGEDEGKIPELKVYLSEVRFPLRSVLQLDARKGSNTLDRLFGSRDVFRNPKPIELLEHLLPFTTDPDSLTLDYFAGSGTTAHAVINLNRDDGGTRRFILVEQGEYFDTVTLPRVAKVMACPEWKDGKPREGVQHDAAAGDDPDSHWSSRTLPVVQVLRIERYEDSLDALALPGAAAEAGQGELAGFDALLRYVADITDTPPPANPVRLSTAALARPLHYRLPTVWEGRAIERPVDLLHTALLLLGLHPVRLRRLSRPAAAGDGPALLAEVRPHRPGQPAAAVPLELLLLREHDVDNLTPAELRAQMQAEYDWLAGAVQQHFGRALASYACVHHNRDLLLPGQGERGASLDAALAQAMWSRDPAFSAAA
ncbi:MAG: site-specific DNA-methyltransferase [Rubrivivax sp.]|nr:site-specific DNA-methyltransferase [Rubrivivax sp.]